MKKLIVLSILIGSVFSCKKVTDPIEPVKPIIVLPETISAPNLYVTQGYSELNNNSAVITSDGNILMIITNENINYLVKLTKSGNEIWKKTYGALVESDSVAVIEQNNAYFILSITKQDYTNKKNDLILIKTDTQGEQIWSKSYGSYYWDDFFALRATADGNLVIAGYVLEEAQVASCFDKDLYLRKVDADGKVLWGRSYGLDGIEFQYRLTENQIGNINLHGLYHCQEYATSEIFEMDGQTGDWLTGYGQGSLNYELESKNVKQSTILLSDGSYMTCGTKMGNGYSQLHIVKTDEYGKVKWEREYGENNRSESGYCLVENSDGSIVICGVSGDSQEESNEVMLLKIGSKGNLIWFKKFGKAFKDYALNLLKDGDDYYITGTNNLSGKNVFMTRIDKNGVFKP